ncbi:uncharacterized protein LOC127709009 [Mytilus californianus]|uniref:uncharacterized protein LOC127709009 n=1 Tax=Mytilus californianus TaxID=6549 RepID=UPI002246E8D6|nr:uncharacterized protein LOC127709009 [Mytilus californianus]
MGTQIFSDETDKDAESIIKYTRQPKKPPAYVPRSRSLDDLPGGLRVPILKKPDSRFQQKYEANVAGLEELKMLRQKHGKMVEDITATLVPQEKNQIRSSPIRLSSSSLAIIKEEPQVNSEFHVRNTKDESQRCKVRFSICSDDSLKDNSMCSSESNVSGSTESLTHPSREIDDQIETRTREQMLANFPTIQPPIIQQRRRASIQVDTLTNSMPPPVDRSIRPKLRRASFQCEAVITKQFERGDSVSKLISDFKLQYNFPSPVHAVTRQYGSSSDIKMKDKMESSPSAEKDLKTILTEWEGDRTANKKQTKSGSANISTKVNTEGNTKYRTETNSIGHARNLSFTSDYFGSTETLNTTKSFPLAVKGNEGMQIRRQSLPVILTRNESVSETVPKLPERRRSLIDNKPNTKDNFKRESKLESKIQTQSTESDDGIFHDEDELTRQELTNKFHINDRDMDDVFRHKKRNESSRPEIKVTLALETAL